MPYWKYRFPENIFLGSRFINNQSLERKKMYIFIVFILRWNWIINQFFWKPLWQRGYNNLYSFFVIFFSGKFGGEVWKETGSWMFKTFVNLERHNNIQYSSVLKYSLFTHTRLKIEYFEIFLKASFVCVCMKTLKEINFRISLINSEPLLTVLFE